MDKEYIDFKIALRWHEPATPNDPEQISTDVKYLDGGSDVTASSTRKDISAVTTLLSGQTKLADIIQHGTALADILLPDENGIRQTFRDLWQAGHKIRLWLIYPHKAFDGDIVKRNEQIENIMRIRWENICLPQNATTTPGLQHCLGTRPEISIVHHLRNSEAIELKALPATEVPASIKYFSRLADNVSALGNLIETDDERIFGEFRQRMANAADFFDISTLDPDPAEIDVIQAFQEEDVVQLIVHGNVDQVKIDDNNVLTQHEVLRAFLPPNQPAVKAIILLSCNSASYIPNGSLNISTVLHRHAGVPIVVGTTGAIPISAAERFVEGFYKEIGENPNIDLEQAVPVGRNSILNEGLNPHDIPSDEREWDASFGLPRLFLNSTDSMLIPLEQLFGPDHRSAYFEETIERETGFRPANYDPTKNDWKTVIDWLMTPERRWFLVTGLGGSGKSTQLTWLIDHFDNVLNSPKIVYHFCQAEAPKTTQPLDFVYSTLVPQLIDLYGASYANLLRERIRRGRNPRLVSDPQEALADFVIEPLAALRRDGLIRSEDEPIIMIDGIDLVLPDRDVDNSILGLLESARGRLDQVARILVTAEEDLISIQNDQNRAKVITDRVFALANHADDRVPDLNVKALPANTPPFFVRVQNNLNSPKSKVECWDDLYILLDSRIDALEDEYGKIIGRLLDIAAVAREPLHGPNTATIACCALKRDHDYAHSHLHTLLEAVQPFFKGEQARQDKLVWYHGGIQEHLLRKERSAAMAHSFIVEAFQPERGTDWANITDWATLADTNWYRLSDPTGQNSISADQLAAMATYVKQYLADHAYLSFITSDPETKVGQKRKETFLDLICDLGYRTVRYRTIGPIEAVQDLWRGLEVIYRSYLAQLPKDQRRNQEARLVFNRLVAAKQPESPGNKALTKLETSLRQGRSVKSDLKAFLFESK